MYAWRLVAEQGGDASRFIIRPLFIQPCIVAGSFSGMCPVCFFCTGALAGSVVLISSLGVCRCLGPCGGREMGRTSLQLTGGQEHLCNSRFVG